MAKRKPVPDFPVDARVARALRRSKTSRVVNALPFSDPKGTVVRPRIIVGVDPGLNGTGVAVVERYDTGLSIMGAAVLYVPNKQRQDSWTWRAEYLAVELERTIHELIPNAHLLATNVGIVCEFPQMFGSAGSRMGFSTGDLVKLAHLVGVFHGTVLHQMNERLFHPVEVNTWKGQMPKDVVMRRLQKFYREDPESLEGIETHAWDALGIATWAHGAF